MLTRVLRSWLKRYGAEPTPCGPEATLEEAQEEIKRLREAELEREILKRAMAYFAKESQ